MKLWFSVLFDWYLADKYSPAEKSSVGLRTFCFSPDNRYLATAGTDHKIRVSLDFVNPTARPHSPFVFKIWDIDKKGIRNIFKDDKLLLGPLHFLSNGRFVVSASRDSEVCVWNMRTGTPTFFKGTGNQTWGVRSSPDGRYIAAGATDVVLIWAIRSSALVNCSLEHPGDVTALNFTQDGMRLVTGSIEGTLKFWDISSLRGNGTVDGVQCLRDFDGAVCVISFCLTAFCF